MKNFILFACLTLLLFHSAFANDSTATTAAGGIQFTKTNDIKMVSEHLQVSLKRIKVDYIFKNISDHDVITTIVFPLPEFVDADIMGSQVVWDDEVCNSANCALGTFKIIVNGKSVPHHTLIRAMLNNKDITKELKQNGIPLNTTLAYKNGIGELDVDENGNIDGLFSEEQFQTWITKAKQLGFMDKDSNPLWQKQVMYYWTQTFPAHQNITISHEYAPTNGWNDIDEWMTRDCLINLFDIDWETAIGKLVANSDPICVKDNDEFYMMTNWPEYFQLAKQDYSFAKHVKYILTTGANWAGPIEHFTLDIQYPKKNAAVLFSQFYEKLPVKIIKTPGNIHIAIDNFTPRQDLSVVVVDKNR